MPQPIETRYPQHNFAQVSRPFLLVIARRQFLNDPRDKAVGPLRSLAKQAEPQSSPTVITITGNRVRL